MVALVCSLACERRASKLVINEIYPSGPGSDFVELYNETERPLDVGGYALYDDPRKKYVFPEGTQLLPRGFLAIPCNGTGEGLNASFRLSGDGELISLENKRGRLVDRVRYPRLRTGHSYGRYPDGKNGLSVLAVPTEGEPNRGGPQ